ncbi:hypothetical protein AB0G79_06485 [Streptomyces sp. NPDC020807]|uniref:hypothetical protein n=1 Tax=Streptomyces sp. NPDC020807 TaxID=3155119 RepID=UPI0033D73AF6
MHAPSTPAADRPSTAPVPTPRPSGPSRTLRSGRSGRGPRSGALPEPTTGTAEGTGGDPAGDVVRWSAFCCVLVPVVLLAYGTSLGGAAGTAFGLVSVTAACRVLLRRSERGLHAESGRTRRRN